MPAPLLQRILVLEDDPDLRTLVSLALRTLGRWEVSAFPDARHALQAAAGLRPQMLVSDIELPGMRGPDLWQALMALPGLAHLPAVFLSGRDLPPSLRHRTREPVVLVRKPFDPISLPAQLQAIWNRQLERRMEPRPRALD